MIFKTSENNICMYRMGMVMPEEPGTKPASEIVKDNSIHKIILQLKEAAENALTT